jgi:hypothetical protein
VNRTRTLLALLLIGAIVVAAVEWWLWRAGGRGEVLLVSGCALAVMGLGVQVVAWGAKLVGGDPKDVSFPASVCTVLGSLATIGGTADTLRTQTGESLSYGWWIQQVGVFAVVLIVVASVPYWALAHVRGSRTTPVESPVKKG